jgi:hypothetical protein
VKANQFSRLPLMLLLRDSIAPHTPCSRPSRAFCSRFRPMASIPGLRR